jgi:cysteine synthase A
VITIAKGEAMKWSRELVQKEGIFIGITAGTTFSGALQLCAGAKPGDTASC